MYLRLGRAGDAQWNTYVQPETTSSKLPSTIKSACHTQAKCCSCESDLLRCAACRSSKLRAGRQGSSRLMRDLEGLKVVAKLICILTAGWWRHSTLMLYEVSQLSIPNPASTAELCSTQDMCAKRTSCSVSVPGNAWARSRRCCTFAELVLDLTVALML